MPANNFNKNPRPNPAQNTARAPQNDKSGPIISKPVSSPLLSNNPINSHIILFKQLTAYPNYGNPSKNADILYTGTHGEWDFELPQFLLIPGRFKTQLLIRAVLDDHVNVPSNRYSAKIAFNGSVIHNGRLQLEHGTPAGGMFVNWGELVFSLQNIRKDNHITIENTSAAGFKDWIGLDWIELRQYPK